MSECLSSIGLLSFFIMNQKPDYKLVFSIFVIAVVWGTTYLGIRVAVETIPPWFVTSIRQAIAALLILVILLYKKELTWIGWTNFRHQFIPAILMIVIANGFTTIGEKTVPSGLTSILSAMSPIIIFLGSLMAGIEKPSIKGIVGVILGFLGVVFIFREGLGAILDPNYKTGILFLSLAILGWSIGMIYSKKHMDKTDNIALKLFYQFTIAAIVQFILAFIFSSDASVHDWSYRSVFAMLYLAVFGSVLTFFCYHYALKKVSAVQISYLNYFNTIIAVFLGWLLLDEIITFDFIIATALIILGVFVTNYKRN